MGAGTTRAPSAATGWLAIARPISNTDTTMTTIEEGVLKIRVMAVSLQSRAMDTSNITPVRRFIPFVDASEVRMEAEHLDQDRAAIAVVAWMIDELQAAGRRQASPEVRRVIRLENILASVA